MLQAAQAVVPAGSTLCVAGEWYRYPSSFLIAREELQPAFVRDGPASLLPIAFDRERGTAGTPPNMNDQNREEPSRYVAPATCDYFIALLPPADAPADAWQPEYALPLNDPLKWVSVAGRPFLDAGRSSFPWRAFEFPFGISASRNTYGQYAIVKRDNDYL